MMSCFQIVAFDFKLRRDTQGTCLPYEFEPCDHPCQVPGTVVGPAMSCSPRHRMPFNSRSDALNSVSAFPESLISSKPRVYLLTDREPGAQSASWSVGFSTGTVLIARTGFDTATSIPDPTLSFKTGVA